MARWQRTLANPIPLGLMGVGVSTLYFGMALAGWFETQESEAVILPLFVFTAGMATFLAAILSFVRGHTFYMTLFLGYSGLWMTRAVAAIIAQISPVLSATSDAGETFLAAAWFIFTVFMYLGSLIQSFLLQIALLLQSVGALLQTIGYAVGTVPFLNAPKKVSGYFFIVSGFLMILVSGVEVNIHPAASMDHVHKPLIPF